MTARPEPETELYEFRDEPPPDFRKVAVPADYRDHPLVRGRLFFTLPIGLLAAIDQCVGFDIFDPDLIQLEYALADACGERCVGSWGDRLLDYPYLGRRDGAPPPDLEELAEPIGINPAKVELALRRADEPLQAFHATARGYAGWLLTTPQFLQEHDELFETWASEVSRWGIPPIGPLASDAAGFSGLEPANDSASNDFVQAFEKFFIRWRLRGLAAPYLPNPLSPNMAGAIPSKILPQLLQAGGSMFFLPDTFPVPSRDELRYLLEASLRGGQNPEHLEEWMGIVGAADVAKNRIPRFARIFEIQHYWRALQQRHAEALAGNLGRLKQAFAAYFEISADTIHRDMLLISRSRRMIRRKPSTR